jgi:hypothetical protein
MYTRILKQFKVKKYRVKEYSKSLEWLNLTFESLKQLLKIYKKKLLIGFLLIL